MTFRVRQVTLPITNGNTVDVVGVASDGVVSFAVLFGCGANATNNPAANAGLSIGFWDGTNQSAGGISCIDAQPTTSTARASNDAFGLLFPNAAGTNFGDYTVSAITDGIRITKTSGTTTVGRFATVILAYGITKKKLVTVTPNATQNATANTPSLGFTPESALVMSVLAAGPDQAVTTSALISLGLARKLDGRHRALSWSSQGVVGAEVANVQLSESRCCCQIFADTFVWSLEATAWNADDITFTTRDGTPGTDVVFVLALGDDCSIDFDTLTSPTATGVDTVATANTPQAVFLAMSLATGTTLETNDNANALMLGAGDADGQFSHNIFVEDAETVTNTGSTASATAIMDVDDSVALSTVAVLDATLDALNANGFDLNYTDVDPTPLKGIFISFGAAASAATAITLSGPATSTINTPSTNFTVGANGAITGTVTVTPTTSGTGSFNPSSVQINSASPTATFTYTGTVAETVNINCTNDGSLDAPANVAHEVQAAAAATAITLTGPSTSIINSPSANFIVAADGAITGDVVVTPDSSAGTGSFSPTTVTLNTSNPTDTFTYTGTSLGARNIGCTNDGALDDPPDVAHTVNAAGAIPSINAQNAFVKNFDTDATYYTKGTGLRSLASMTKLMTGRRIRMMKPLDADMDSTITIQAGDLTPGSNLLAGDVVSFRSLFYNILVKSDNGSAHAVARALGDELGAPGGMARFVTEMNADAVALGMASTTYTDASGFDADNVSTPEDTLVLLQTIYDEADPLFLDADFLGRVQMPITRGGSPLTFAIDRPASNTIMGDVGVFLGKSGTLTGAVTAYNFAICWEAPNGQTIGICVMGTGPNDAARTADLRAIIAQLVIDFPALATAEVPFTPDYLFETLGYGGAEWDDADIDILSQDAAGTTPVAANDDPVGREDPTTFGASTPSIALTQSTAGRRPLYKTSNPRIVHDGTDDVVTLGAAGFGDTTLFAAAGQQFIAACKFGTAVANRTILAKAGAVSGNRNYQAFLATDGTISQNVRGTVNAMPDALDDGEDHFILTVWDGIRFTHTIDGFPARQLAVGSAAEETGEEILFGARTASSPATFLNGYYKYKLLADGAPSIDIQRRLRDWFNGGTVNAFSDPTGGAGGSEGTPEAPLTVTAEPGDEHVVVSGTPGGDGGSPITGYIADDGEGGHTTAAGPLPRIVTGLPNDVPVTPRLRAVNENGNGPFASGPTVTPQEPVFRRGGSMGAAARARNRKRQQTPQDKRRRGG